MLSRKSVWGALALLLMASLASAQEQPGRGRRGGGGFGGPGGMGAMMGSPVMLLTTPQVREELKLTEQQSKEVDEALAKANPGRGGGGGGNFQDLSEEEREKRREERRKQMDEATASVKKVLTPEQNKRLDQLALQRQGMYALTRPEIVKELGLSEEQKEKIEKIQESARPQFGQGQGSSPEDRQKAFAEMQKKQAEAQTEAVAVLTDAQKQKWAEMKGKEFTFPQFGGGGFGRGGGPGGPGGQRERPATKERE